ncbi:hypothetical protein AMTR_s00036p00076520 [Amborella trichopoda]|uniref:Uncharacterized protein n=1 Tax=Amborella trichopoda TaxID=13333 RepID=U5D1N0_AMBTC|nr:hypothetical protein AMTR_s00036p00076520 [Amborella trichopoda]
MFKEHLKTLAEDLAFVKRTLTNHVRIVKPARVRMPKPKAFGGAHSSKEEDIKRELKEQFLPVLLVRHFKYTAIVYEYMKQFSSLMLDIKNMLEEAKLFSFIGGLQSWANAELTRQRVKDLPVVVVVAVSLVNFKLDASSMSN